MKEALLIGSMVFGLAGPSLAEMSDRQKALQQGFNFLLHEKEEILDDQAQPITARYRGLYDFDAPAKEADSVAPWIKEDGSVMDVTNATEALELAQKMQRYVYEGWFDGVAKMDTDKHFKSNSYRTWCSTPWLNVNTEKGRDAIHGLTKEFPLEPEAIREKYYPELVIEKYAKTSWGVAYFNKPTCDMYGRVFGTPENPKEPTLPTTPEALAQRKRDFRVGEGAVSFKLLFSTVTSDEYVKADGSQPFKKAYSWNAYISAQSSRPSDPPKPRQLIPATHIQMDIAIRSEKLVEKHNSKLDGKDRSAPWVMLTYYFDPDYQAKHLDGLGLPEGFEHMRPLGVQFGLGRGESVIFQGSKNNEEIDDFAPKNLAQFENGEVPAEAIGQRLNGPADNPKSSCLGCHANAAPKHMRVEIYDPGTAEMTPLSTIPGVISNFAYNELVDKKKAGEDGIRDQGFHFNFNQQVRIAFEQYQNCYEGKDRCGIENLKSFVDGVKNLGD